MLTLINIFPAIKEHFKTLKEDSYLVTLIVLFLILPLGFSSLFLGLKVIASEKVLNTLITAFAIFIGLIINFLVILIDRKRGKKGIEKQLIEHLSYNSIYELVVGLFVLFLSMILLVIQDKIGVLLNYILSFVIYLLVFNFILTLLMIAKRFFVLFKNNIEK